MAVRKFFSLYGAMLLKNMRESTAYKFDFILGILAHLLIQASSLLLVMTVYTHTDSMGGFTFEQSLILYGCSLLATGIEEFFLHACEHGDSGQRTAPPGQAYPDACHGWHQHSWFYFGDLWCGLSDRRICAGRDFFWRVEMSVAYFVFCQWGIYYFFHHIDHGDAGFLVHGCSECSRYGG